MTMAGHSASDERQDVPVHALKIREISQESSKLAKSNAKVIEFGRATVFDVQKQGKNASTAPQNDTLFDRSLNSEFAVTFWNT